MFVWGSGSVLVETERIRDVVFWLCYIMHGIRQIIIILLLTVEEDKSGRQWRVIIVSNGLLALMVFVQLFGSTCVFRLAIIFEEEIARKWWL